MGNTHRIAEETTNFIISDFPRYKTYCFLKDLSAKVGQIASAILYTKLIESAHKKTLYKNNSPSEKEHFSEDKRNDILKQL